MIGLQSYDAQTVRIEMGQRVNQTICYANRTSKKTTQLWTVAEVGH